MRYVLGCLLFTIGYSVWAMYSLILFLVAFCLGSIFTYQVLSPIASSL